jgi:hypothetical protein
MNLSWNIFLIILLAIFGIRNIIGQQNNYINEISYIYSISNQDDIENILKFYSQYRDTLWFIKNNVDPNNSGFISQKLNSFEIDQQSISEFTELWREDAINHQSKTKERNKEYSEGVQCLKSLLQNELIDYKNQLRDLKVKIHLAITEKEAKKVQRGIIDYSEFVIRIKERFLIDESLMYSTIGESITGYNQISFELISEFITSEYGFGLDAKYKNFVLSLYDFHPELNKIFLEYKEKEVQFVEKISHEKCLKRVGILRFYDLLSADKKEQAIKINMIMNAFI